MADQTPDDDSIAALFSRLIEDVEQFVRAELRLYRAKLLARTQGARGAILMILISFLLAQSAVVALLVGLIAILAGPLGAIGATLVVIGGAIGIAGLLGYLAFTRIRNAIRIEDRRQ